MESSAVWSPDESFLRSTHLHQMMQALGLKSYEALHAWSVANRLAFWEWMTFLLDIRFTKPYREIADFSRGIENPAWFPGAKLNIFESCFSAAANATAIHYYDGGLRTISYAELRRLCHRVANSLSGLGLKPGDAVAIDMPLTVEAVAIYLGALAAGMAVVGIADSFAAHEIKIRLQLGKAKLIFTQDFIIRGDNRLPLYEKVKQAESPRAVVFPAQGQLQESLRAGDISWEKFLSQLDRFVTVACDPQAPINILFSSGTTGEPKAIPWDHTTAIKCAADAYLHHDIHPDDRLAWPTSLGWMMGPWLIFAALINRASLGIFYGLPSSREFAQFVASAKITMLGVVPSLVKLWRATQAFEGLDLTKIKLFSSTGECSNPSDMRYLMEIAGHKPLIEYCGGTEIGGGYITSTLVQSSSPSSFTTPAMGLDFTILDEDGKPTNNGELFIIPPSIGLSSRLLNRDHHQVYYEDTPVSAGGELLRRHGDQIERLPNGLYRAHGRVDDTMNLGGIKVSSAEIEKVVNQVDGIHESAAIAVSPRGGGPSLLVIFAVVSNQAVAPISKDELKQRLQRAIKEKLNPLFKIDQLISVESLPRTASNKIMRRILRDQYDRSTI